MFGGERGIRTPGSVKISSFQDYRNRPLCQFSEAKVVILSQLTNIFFRTSKIICSLRDIWNIPKPFQTLKELYLLYNYEKIKASTTRLDQLDEQEYPYGAIGHRVH